MSSQVSSAIRKRGNPNWGVPFRGVPAAPTQFEMQVTQLRLAPEGYVCSPELRTWCEENRNRCYVPEWLLTAWDMQVDADLAGTAQR
jgi:hypothetical protein